jgi:biotin-(acetyl-CoA carboxylase) ligase
MMVNYIKTGDRLQITNQAIFGICLGITEDGKVVFVDEETGEIKKFSTGKVSKTHDKH